MASPVRQARDDPQLPDFDNIARCHHSLATELAKCRNVPAFDLGLEILNEMRRINEKIDRFDCRLKAMEVNNVARLINRSLAEPDGQLSPLHNVATNELIDRFPATPRAIKDMPGAALNMVLRALGIETDGGLEQRRQKLRVQIGLKADPSAMGCTLEYIFCRIPILSKRSIIAAVLVCVLTAAMVNFDLLNAPHSFEGQRLLTTHPSQDDMEVLIIITTTAFLISLLIYRAFQTTSYIRIIVGFVSGFEFGLGLIISGLATPRKVLALFSVRDRKIFDPSLALVLPFGVLPTLIRLWLRGFSKSLRSDPAFHPPTLTVAEIDWRFYAGIAALSIGWSRTGACLGPAILRAVLEPFWGCSWGGGFATGYLLLP